MLDQEYEMMKQKFEDLPQADLEKHQERDKECFEKLSDRGKKERDFVISRDWRLDGRWYCCIIKRAAKFEDSRPGLILDITEVCGIVLVLVAFDVNPWTYGDAPAETKWISLNYILSDGWEVD